MGEPTMGMVLAAIKSLDAKFDYLLEAMAAEGEPDPVDLPEIDLDGLAIGRERDQSEPL